MVFVLCPEELFGWEFKFASEIQPHCDVVVEFDSIDFAPEVNLVEVLRFGNLQQGKIKFHSLSKMKKQNNKSTKFKAIHL